MTVSQIKVGLNDTLLLAVLYLLDISTVTQKQPQCSQDDTLSRSRFSSDYRETWKEINVKLVYQRKILYI